MAAKSYWSFPCWLLRFEFLMRADAPAVAGSAWFWSNCLNLLHTSAHKLSKLEKMSNWWHSWKGARLHPRGACLPARCWFDLSHCNNNREKTTEMAKECQSCKPFCWNFGKVFFDSAVVFFGKHLRYESALSPSCHPVLMINVKLSDRIPVPMSLRGDER